MQFILIERKGCLIDVKIQLQPWLLDNQLSLLEMSLLILFWELYLHMKRRFLNLQRAGGAHGWCNFSWSDDFSVVIWKPMLDSRDIFVCACMHVCLNISGCFQYLWNRGRTVCIPLWIPAKGIHANLLLFM